MSARTEVHTALLRAGYGAPGADRLLDQVEADAVARGSEKSTPGGSQPREDEATHRHPRPCEFPTVMPCTCPRPSALSDASFARARRRARIASFIHGARDGHAAVWAGAAR